MEDASRGVAALRVSAVRAFDGENAATSYGEPRVCCLVEEVDSTDLASTQWFGLGQLT